MMREVELSDAFLRDVLEAASTECPPIETIAAVAEGSAAPSEALKIRTHAASCARCGGELELATAFFEPALGAEADGLAAELEQRIAPELAANEPAVAKPRSVPRAWWLIAAAALLALALLPIVRSAGPLAVPEFVEEGELRGRSLAVIEPQGRISNPPTALRWSGAPGVDHYRVDLRRVDRSVIWSAEVDQLETTLPMSVMETLHERTKYHWSVIGLDAEGRAIASSREVGFVIDPSEE